jgi:hypothetical protein
MAIQYGDGKAGQFAKAHATDRTNKLINVMLVSLAVPTGLCGCCIGIILSHQLAARFAWARSYPLMYGVSLLCLISIFAAIWWCKSRVFAAMDRLLLERIHYVHGGQTEALIAWRLRGLDDRWHLFNNVKLKDDGDLDHVVIGPGGVFCLSAKSHKGNYAINSAGEYLLNGKPTDHLVEARRYGFKLRDWLTFKLQNSPESIRVPFVQPVLVVPFARIDFPAQQQAAWAYSDDDLLDVLLERKERISAEAVAVYAQAVADLAKVERLRPPPREAQKESGG